MLILYNKKKFIKIKKINLKKILGITQPKYYLRSVVNNFIIDNFNKLSKIKFKNFKVGNSFSITTFDYVNKYNKSLKFSYFFKKTSKVESYLTNFFSIFKNKEYYLVILKPVLGGLKIYSLGVKGFLPKNELYFLKKISKFFLKNIFLMSFINTNFFNLRLYLPNYKKVNYSKFSKKKKYKLHPFNIVFKFKNKSL